MLLKSLKHEFPYRCGCTVCTGVCRDVVFVDFICEQGPYLSCMLNFNCLDTLIQQVRVMVQHTKEKMLTQTKGLLGKVANLLVHAISWLTKVIISILLLQDLVEQIEVFGRTSSTRFDNVDGDVQELARELQETRKLGENAHEWMVRLDSVLEEVRKEVELAKKPGEEAVELLRSTAKVEQSLARDDSLKR